MAALTVSYVIPATGATPPTSLNFAGALMSYDVSAAADGDVTVVVPHLFGAAPLMFWGQQKTSQALTALSAFTLTADATNVTVTKLASTGSAGASQYRVYVMKPHTIIF